MPYVGIDACKGGWIALVLTAGTRPRAVFARTLEELGVALPDAEGFGVDIPIGLLDDGRRRADLLARELVGARRNSVFHTPVRAALQAPDHPEATAISRRRTGHGISAQAYALRPRILEAGRWCEQAPAPVWEVHPEVSFAVLLGHPARAPKSTWAGMLERLEALRAAGIDLDDLGDAGGRAGVDDVLDAAIVAWSTQRLVAGTAMSLPDPPEQEPATGRPIAIWA